LPCTSSKLYYVTMECFKCHY